MQPQKKNPFDVSLCRFLYVVGIQSVRILKRINRRIARFFRPAVCSAVALCRRVAGPHVAALKAEGARVGESFQIARKRIHCAWEKGPVPAAGEFFRSAGKSMRRHGLVRVFNIAASVVGVCILVSIIQNWTNQDFNLLLQQGEQTVAVLKDEQTFQQVEEVGNIHKLSSAATRTSYTPRYTLTNAAGYTSPAMLCDARTANSGEHIAKAVGLYIDGELVGALKSQADLTFLLQERLNQGRGEDTSASASFVQQIEQVEGLYPVEHIITGAELREILNSSSQEEIYYTVQPDDTLTGIAEAYEMDLEVLTALNPDIIPEQMRDGDLVKIQQEKPFLNVQVVRREEYDEPVAYSTITTQDEDEYTDYSLVTQEGQDGEEHCVDQVVYIDGVETSRETTARTVTKEPVDKLVIVGTKQRPLEGWATGEMVWPLPYTHNITSQFGGRWGTIHKGMDISSGGVYGQPIVAADGGTVQYVKYLENGYGYHLAIDHGNGLVTLYAHASAIYVTSGQKVAKGQTIAAVGNTGNSTGPHLHFEVHVGGTAVDPRDYICSFIDL